MITDLAETIFLCDLVKKYLENEGMEEVEDYDEVDKNLQESNVNQGYDIYPTSAKWFTDYCYLEYFNNYHDKQWRRDQLMRCEV